LLYQTAAFKFDDENENPLDEAVVVKKIIDEIVTDRLEWFAPKPCSFRGHLVGAQHACRN